MAKIKVLEAQLSNMIAAGEVVERPSAVVKELIENAIDAQANNIDIFIEEGGLLSIEVKDDGFGMDEEDALKCLERHATSKIQDEQELFAPPYLGFRGEALPSIASVSKLSIKTSTINSGAMVYVEFGDIKKHHPYVGPQGSSIRVEALFHQTPARLKHMKSIAYEQARIVSLVEKFALANEGIGFRLYQESQLILNTNGSKHLKETFTQIYGSYVGRHMHYFEFEDFDFSVKGLWGESHLHRSSQKDILIFINQRIVRHPKLNKAILEAYQDFIPAHRYPVVLLHITVDHKLVDVNVHPSKWELRLSKEQQLYYLIVDELRKLLHQVSQVKPASIEPFEVFEEQTELFDLNHYQSQEQLDLKHEVSTFPVLDLIGQMHGRYILASSEDALYWIDQHAAKERVNYEKILNELENDSNTYELLLPLQIELSPSIMTQFDELQKALSPLSIQFERFSSSSIVIRVVPLWARSLDLEHLFLDLIERYESEHALTRESIQDATIATLACHRSVRFNEALNREAMKQIIDELSLCKQPYHCPHGRPTLVKISTHSMFRDFDR